MVVKVSDDSGEAILSLFNEQAERMFGCSADELDKLKSQVNSWQYWNIYEFVQILVNLKELLIDALIHMQLVTYLVA